MDNRGIGGTAAVVSKVTGSFDDSGMFDRLPINHLDPNFNSGKRSMWFGDHGLCGCWKKVVMRNPLNVLVGI